MNEICQGAAATDDSQK